MSKLRRLGLVLALVLAPLGPSLGQSVPFPRQVRGCVIDGAFVTTVGYRFDIRRASDRRPLELAPYEGRLIRFEGQMAAGFVFYAAAAPAVLGTCPGVAPRRN